MNIDEINNQYTRLYGPRQSKQSQGQISTKRKYDKIAWTASHVAVAEKKQRWNQLTPKNINWKISKNQNL